MKEYLAEYIDISQTTFSHALNHCAGLGWTLVQILPTRTTHEFTAIMERERKPDE